MHNATDAAALSDPFSRTLLPASFVVALVLSVVALLLAGGQARAQEQVQYQYSWAATHEWAAEWQTIAITSEEIISEAISVPVDAIVAAVRDTSDRTPPELAGDVMDRGMVLTGGGALLRMLDERLAREPGIPVHVADGPLMRVAVGSGRFLEETDRYRGALFSGWSPPGGRRPDLPERPLRPARPCPEPHRSSSPRARPPALPTRGLPLISIIPRRGPRLRPSRKRPNKGRSRLVPLRRPETSPASPETRALLSNPGT